MRIFPGRRSRAILPETFLGGTMKPGFALILGLAIGMGACGGGGGDDSGVDGSKPITELSTSEVQSLCEWAIETQGGEGAMYECEDDVTVTVDTVAECVAGYGDTPETCNTVTVAELEACIEAWSAEPCGFGGQACAEYFQCYFEGQQQ